MTTPSTLLNSSSSRIFGPYIHPATGISAALSSKTDYRSRTVHDVAHQEIACLFAIARLNSSLTYFQRAVTSRDKVITELQSEIQDHVHKIQQLKEQISVCEIYFNHQCRLHDMDKRRIEVLEKNLKDCEQRNRSLEEQLKKRHTEREGLLDQLSLSEVRCSSFQAKTVSLERRCKDMADFNSTQERIIHQLYQEHKVMLGHIFSRSKFIHEMQMKQLESKR